MIPARPLWAGRDYRVFAADAQNIQQFRPLDDPARFPPGSSQVDGAYSPFSVIDTAPDVCGAAVHISVRHAIASCVHFVSASPMITMVRVGRVYHCAIGELTACLRTSQSELNAPSYHFLSPR